MSDHEKLLELRAAALALSDAMHVAEAASWEFPDFVDRAWDRLSQALEASSPNK